MIKLLPNKYRVAGWIALTFGVVMALVRFYFDIKLSLFNIKVFAVYSKYFETNYFKIIDNHFSEEITALLLLTGLFLLGFTKEKIESKEINEIRTKSLILSFYLNTLFMMASFLFIYGFVFINILVINIFTPLIFYILVFKVLLYKRKSQSISINF